MDWTAHLSEQLTWHWDKHVRPRLETLTDDEYFWEPVDGCWSIRPRSEARGKMPVGAGDLVMDFEFPEPPPPPVTTIAWRLGHVTIGIFAQRTASHFGGPPASYDTAVWPGDARSALAALDDAYTRWVAGVRSLDAEGLERAVGPAEGPFAEFPYADLVLHINREAIHHLAEVLVLRDLYRASH
jgi:DinB superfamily